jgi:hypothetical protein
MMMASWQLIGTVKPQDLAAGRLQLHFAIQFIAAIGAALAEPQLDDSHTSLEWRPDLGVFAGAPIPVSNSLLRVALNPIDLTSLILDPQGKTIATYALHQKTLAAGLDWHKLQLAQLGADTRQVAFLTYPPDDFPDHPLAQGAPFVANQAESERDELQRYYANTHQLLQEIVATTEGASAIHLWPHHFDMAMLISLPSQGHGEAKTIGVGLSPGDQSYREPYWYVSAYPYPNIANLPALEGNGFWQTQGWVGAVLPASGLGTDSAQAQELQVRAFLDNALQVSQALQTA